MEQRVDGNVEELRLARFERLISEGLKVTQTSADRFEAPATGAVFDRIYGGQVLAQSLLAAIATVASDRPLHSVHAYFLRLGHPSDPVHFDVDRTNDSRSFSTRLVQASQRGEPVVTALLSFHHPTDEVVAHQDAMPEVPPPDEFASRDARLVEHYGDDLPSNAGLAWPVEIRYIDRQPWDPTPSSGRNRMWVRLPRTVPTNEVPNSVLLLFASDLTMFEPVIARHDLRWEDLIGGATMFGATLDHSLWLHRDIVFDDWLLHVQESTVAADGRGFTTGRFFTRSGALIASVAQEIVIKSAQARS